MDALATFFVLIGARFFKDAAVLKLGSTCVTDCHAEPFSLRPLCGDCRKFVLCAGETVRLSCSSSKVYDYTQGKCVKPSVFACRPQAAETTTPGKNILRLYAFDRLFEGIVNWFKFAKQLAEVFIPPKPKSPDNTPTTPPTAIPSTTESRRTKRGFLFGLFPKKIVATPEAGKAALTFVHNPTVSSISTNKTSAGSGSGSKGGGDVGNSMDATQAPTATDPPATKKLCIVGLFGKCRGKGVVGIVSKAVDVVKGTLRNLFGKGGPSTITTPAPGDPRSPRCIDSCAGRPTSRFNKCGDCTVYIQCVSGITYNMPCPAGLLYDRDQDKCLSISSTCS